MWGIGCISGKGETKQGTGIEEYQRPVGPNLCRARYASYLMYVGRQCQEIISHWIIRLRNKATDCKKPLPSALVLADEKLRQQLEAII